MSPMRCFVPGCCRAHQKPGTADFFVCDEHWLAVDRDMRRDFWTAYRRAERTRKPEDCQEALQAQGLILHAVLQAARTMPAKGVLLGPTSRNP